MSNVNLYGAYIDVEGIVEMSDVHHNGLYVNNAKRVSVNSIHGFGAFKLDLPNDVDDGKAAIIQFSFFKTWQVK
ncbi:MAG: hypothetical protein LBC22_03325 [Endomicrobium sp.]|nr:hypothetical protein [Endomicrobium sp.]